MYHSGKEGGYALEHVQIAYRKEGRRDKEGTKKGERKREEGGKEGDKHSILKYSRE